MGINGANTNLYSNLNYTTANLQFRYPANSVSAYTYNNISNSGVFGANNKNGVPAANNTTAAYNVPKVKPAKAPKAQKVEVDDGKISFGKKVGNFFKGVGNFFKGMVCDENGKLSLGQCLKTAALAALTCVAAAFVGWAVIAAGFLAVAAVHLGKGIYNAATAKTDAEAEQAWQNIGSATTEGVLAAVGCKKAGAFKEGGVLGKNGAVHNAGKSVKTSAKGFQDAYRTDGLRGIKDEAGLQYKQVKTEATKAYKSGKAKAKETYNELNNKEARFENRKNTYKGSERAAYEDGYNSVKDATYQDATAKVSEYKRAMESEKKGSPAYKEAQARYEAARTTVETRVNAGEFKGTTPIEQAEIQAKYDAVENAKAQLDGTEAKRAAYNNAKAEYHQAVAQQTANNGVTRFGDYSFRTKAAIQDNWIQPGAKITTLAVAGQGYTEPVYYYGY